MTETVVRQNRIARNADRVGMAAMIVASICLVALGSRWVSGPMVAVVVLVLLLVLGGVLCRRTHNNSVLLWLNAIKNSAQTATLAFWQTL